MGSSTILISLCALIFGLALAATTCSALSLGYYDESCPIALPTIKQVVQSAVTKERRMGASLLRLHFHDCFVNVSSASNLLNVSCTIKFNTF